MDYQAATHRGNAATYFAALAVFFLTVVLFIGVFWWYGRDYAYIRPDKEYFFLVKDCEETTAAAVAGSVYFSGGAGYPIEAGGNRYVAFSCYFCAEDAERVRASMEEKGVFAGVLSLAAAEFSLGGKDASQKNRVEGNLETAETCARVLYDAANGLERGTLSQEEARVAVRGVEKSLGGLCAENGEKLFARWNAVLLSAARRAEEIGEGLLFSKDLRYLQTELCMAVVRADTYFSRA